MTPCSLKVLTLAFVLLAMGAQSSARADATERVVSFNSAIYPPTPFQIRRAKKSGKPLVPLKGQALRGRLSKPNGKGPFPAVILMHGCNGTGAWNTAWTRRLLQWGYVVLDVDSLGPRGHQSVCGRPTVVAGPTRAFDAHGAKSYAATLPFVSPNRIAVMGMSHGGWSTLNAINRTTSTRLKQKAFQVAIALYPYCAGPAELDAPLLILAAGQDDWTPAEKCQTFVKGLKTQHSMKLHIYSNAHHMFDVKGIDRQHLGHVLRYNPNAAKDAIQRVREFLTEHL